MEENERFIIIHLGNPYDFVMKDIVENNTYGVFSNSVEKPMGEIVDLLNKQNQRIKVLEEFKKETFNEIDTELNYLTDKAMDNPVNRGRIKALKQLREYLG